MSEDESDKLLSLPSQTELDAHLLSNTEPTTPNVGITGATSSMDLNNTFNPSIETQIQQPISTTQEDDLKSQLMDELHQTTLRMEKATKETDGTERDILVRELRHRKLELSREIASLAFKMF